MPPPLAFELLLLQAAAIMSAAEPATSDTMGRERRRCHMFGVT